MHMSEAIWGTKITEQAQELQQRFGKLCRPAPERIPISGVRCYSLDQSSSCGANVGASPGSVFWVWMNRGNLTFGDISIASEGLLRSLLPGLE